MAPESLLLLGRVHGRGGGVRAAAGVLFGIRGRDGEPRAGAGGAGGAEANRAVAVSALICLYIFVFTITSQLLYLGAGRIVEGAFPDKAARTAAFAQVRPLREHLTLVVQCS